MYRKLVPVFSHCQDITEILRHLPFQHNDQKLGIQVFDRELGDSAERRFPESLNLRM